MNKKVAAGVAVTVAVASVATNLAFQPDELLHNDAYLENQTRYVQMDDQGEYEIEVTEPEDPAKKDVLRTWLLKLPVPVKALVLLPLWLLGALPVAIGTSLFSAVSPVLAQIVGFLLQAAVLVGVFCAAYKLLFPNRKISELFKKKNRWWLILGALAVTGVDFGLSMVWPGWSAARVAVMIAAGFGILCLLWHRICGKLSGPKAPVVTKKLKLEC